MVVFNTGRVGSKPHAVIPKAMASAVVFFLFSKAFSPRIGDFEPWFHPLS
jgi:hypothetical protein